VRLLARLASSTIRDPGCPPDHRPSAGATSNQVKPVNHEVEIRVRYAETDQMGVVYHAHYLVWCEIGRTELMRSVGLSYADLEKEGTMLAVADASIRFHASARYDDVVTIETRLRGVRSRTVTFSYLLSRGGTNDRQRLASAETTLVALDSGGRPRSLPTHVLELFQSA
jgi:acyl-CoA thioester hydrolase